MKESRWIWPTKQAVEGRPSGSSSAAELPPTAFTQHASAECALVVTVQGGKRNRQQVITAAHHPTPGRRAYATLSELHPRLHFFQPQRLRRETGGAGDRREGAESAREAQRELNIVLTRGRGGEGERREGR